VRRAGPEEVGLMQKVHTQLILILPKWTFLLDFLEFTCTGYHEIYYLGWVTEEDYLRQLLLALSLIIHLMNGNGKHLDRR